MQTSKFLAIGGALAASLALSSGAYAWTPTNIGQWVAAPVQTVQGTGQPDVIFTLIGNGNGTNYLGSNLLNGTTPFNLTQNVNGSFLTASQRHRVTFGDIDEAKGFTYGIQYTIEIDGAFSQDKRLQQIFLGLDVDEESTASATKYIQGILPNPADPTQNPDGPTGNWTLLGTQFNTSITSTDGSAGPVLCGSCVKFLVTDIFSYPLTATNSVNSITNTFDIVNVPEPASLALLGLGLTGLAAARRRKAAKVA